MREKEVLSRIKQQLNEAPLIGCVFREALKYVRRFRFPGSKAYWEQRYSAGGTSGPGSHGKLARFKADTVNTFVEQNDINSVIEFGCGDGNQLGYFRFPSYIGLDVSRSAIKRCIKRFANDDTKSFFIYDPECFHDKSGIFRAELALSLDVIFHLVEDDTFDRYMRHLFSSAEMYVIIYSSDRNELRSDSPHVRHRKFSCWIEANAQEWKLIQKIENPYPEESFSHFFVYRRLRRR